MQNVADEILVVDTGSIDSTVDIAKRLGAKVVYHEWRDDFSEARYFALDQASSEWVFQLDADETLSESSQRVHELVDLKDMDGFYFEIVNANNPSDLHRAVSHKSNRMFKRRGGRLTSP